jgi:hypothetical protein
MINAELLNENVVPLLEVNSEMYKLVHSGPQKHVTGLLIKLNNTGETSPFNRYLRVNVSWCGRNPEEFSIIGPMWSCDFSMTANNKEALWFSQRYFLNERNMQLSAKSLKHLLIRMEKDGYSLPKDWEDKIEVVDD